MLAVSPDPGATVGLWSQARSSAAQPACRPWPLPVCPPLILPRPRRLGTTWPHTWGLPLGLSRLCPFTVWLQEGRNLAEVTKLVSGRDGAETPPPSLGLSPTAPRATVCSDDTGVQAPRNPLASASVSPDPSSGFQVPGDSCHPGQPAGVSLGTGVTGCHSHRPHESQCGA